jgi:hypothetical protein
MCPELAQSKKKSACPVGMPNPLVFKEFKERLSIRERKNNERTKRYFFGQALSFNGIYNKNGLLHGVTFFPSGMEIKLFCFV